MLARETAQSWLPQPSRKSKSECGCLVVEDSGGEVAPEIIRQAFQPFFSTKPAATGLGLSIARTALRAANGDLLFEAGEHGARMKLCLPLTEK